MSAKGDDDDDDDNDDDDDGDDNDDNNNNNNNWNINVVAHNHCLQKREIFHWNILVI